jgi:hypothetical protein
VSGAIGSVGYDVSLSLIRQRIRAGRQYRRAHAVSRPARP